MAIASIIFHLRCRLHAAEDFKGRLVKGREDYVVFGNIKCTFSHVTDRSRDLSPT